MKQETLTIGNFAAFIGMDWGDKEHVYQIFDVALQEVKQGKLQQNPNSLAAWADKIQKRYPSQKIAISIEQSKGAVINFLMEYDCFEVYVIAPKFAAKYREAFTNSGAKDDSNDSGFLLDILMRHRDKLSPWRLEDPQTRKIQILTEKRRAAVNQRTRLSNRLKAVLKQYYPLALDIAGESLYSAIACSFLLRWPNLESLKRSRIDTIQKFYTKHGCRHSKVIEKRLELIKKAKALTSDNVIIESSMIEVQMLVEQLLILNKHIEIYDSTIKKLFPDHQDSEIFSSFPGAGDVLAPRLLAAFGSDRDRFKNAVDLQNYSGIAPVTVQSGNKRLVRWRWSCPKFLRQSFHEYAGESRKYSIWASAYYDKKRQQGKSHNSAVRSLAYKWIRIMFRCWKEQKTYDELAYINALRNNGSDLFQYMTQTS